MGILQGDLFVRSRKVAALSHEVWPSPPNEKLAAESMDVGPGFISLQVNGGSGYNFEDDVLKEIQKIIEVDLSHGRGFPRPLCAKRFVKEPAKTDINFVMPELPPVLGCRRFGDGMEAAGIFNLKYHYST